MTREPPPPREGGSLALEVLIDNYRLGGDHGRARFKIVHAEYGK